MEPEAKYTVVGAVVLVLLATLVGAVLWLRSDGTGTQARQYRIAFEHQSLEGLARRSDVTMRGVRVGSVTSYYFSRDKPGAVDVLIAVDPGAPVLEGASAVVERNLLTGLATVQLANPAGPGKPLRAVRGGALPLIAEGQPAAQQLSAGAADLVQRLNEAMSAQNRAALAETLDNLRRLSGHADRTLSRLDTTIDALAGASRRVGALAGSVQDNAHTLTVRYDQLGAQGARTLGEASEAVRRAGADVAGLARRTDSMLTSSDRDLQETTRSLRAAAESIGLAADRLREPSEILYGPGRAKLGPGEGAR
jgi:phospholipid/cholesterol/gamma-HCH transport system substrate-binding protein